MRLTSVFALMVGAAAEWKDVVHIGDSSALVRSLDARPEALMIGATLLLVASLIRHRRAPKSTK